MDDRIILGIVMVVFGFLIMLVSLIIHKFVFVLPLILVIIGFIIMLNKEEDEIESRKDKKV